MCFGGGGDDTYNAYKTGDYDRWDAAFKQESDILMREARGEITPQQAQQLLAPIRNGAPPPQAAPRAPVQVMSNTSGEPGQFPGVMPTQMTTAAETPAAAFTDQGQFPGSGMASVLARSGKFGTMGVDALGRQLREDPQAAMDMREAIRQRDVGLGKIGIDKAFSKFGDDYYNDYRGDYTGFYIPQVDKQYSKAQDKLSAQLAGRGVLESSVGANSLADLFGDYSDAKTNISNEALDASNKLRGQVESAKSNMYSLNEASADPQAVNAQAVGQATALVAPPQYSPIGDIFASALSSFGNFQQARQNAPARGYTSPYAANTSGAGSSKVVR